MVYIDSCKQCRCDCENGMSLNGLPHKFINDYVVSYYCPEHQGIYQVKLETARNKYDYYGKSFDEMDIYEDYGIFQDIVESLTVLYSTYKFKTFTFNEVHSLKDNDYIEFAVKLPEYQVFQVEYKHKTTHNGYFQVNSHHRIVGYADKIRITIDGELIGFVGNSEMFRLTKNHINHGNYEEVYNVYFKNLK